MMSDKQAVLDALQIVDDPELEISIVELGLVYDVRFEDTHVEVDMTLTSPGCPVAPELMAAVHRSAQSTDGVESVKVNLTFSPPWNPKEHASEDAKFEMGIFD